MVCLATTRILSRMSIIGRKTILEASTTPRLLKVSNLTIRRWCQTGTAPFQTPVEGFELEAVRKNYKIFENTPSFSQREIVLIRRMYKMQKCLDELKNKIEEIGKSNERLHKELNLVVKRINSQLFP